MLKAVARPTDHAKLADMAKDKAPTMPVVNLKPYKVKRLWDNYKVITEIQKTDRLKFVIAAGARDGFRCLSIREFYRRTSDKTWQPGKNGILIPLKSPLWAGVTNGVPNIIEPLRMLIDVLPEAIKVVETIELSDPDNAVWILPRTTVGSRVKATEIKEDTKNENQ